MPKKKVKKQKETEKKLKTFKLVFFLKISSKRKKNFYNEKFLNKTERKKLKPPSLAS